MKKIIKRNSHKENIHILKENENIIAKIFYYETSIPKEFSYTLVIEFKNSKLKTAYSLGSFNITKAKYSLGEIIIEENQIKVIPKKRNTLVYNLHEKDLKEYTFPF